MIKLLELKPWKKTCGICKSQDVAMTKYENRTGSRMFFCTACKRYPERRSFKPIKHYQGKKSNKGVSVNKDVLNLNSMKN